MELQRAPGPPPSVLPGAGKADPAMESRADKPWRDNWLRICVNILLDIPGHRITMLSEILMEAIRQSDLGLTGAPTAVEAQPGEFLRIPNEPNFAELPNEPNSRPECQRPRSWQAGMVTQADGLCNTFVHGLLRDAMPPSSARLGTDEPRPRACGRTPLRYPKVRANRADFARIGRLCSGQA